MKEIERQGLLGPRRLGGGGGAIASVSRATKGMGHLLAPWLPWGWA